jgi:hypothetical protein
MKLIQPNQLNKVCLFGYSNPNHLQALIGKSKKRNHHQPNSDWLTSFGLQVKNPHGQTFIKPNGNSITTTPFHSDYLGTYPTSFSLKQYHHNLNINKTNPSTFMAT